MLTSTPCLLHLSSICPELTDSVPAWPVIASMACSLLIFRPRQSAWGPGPLDDRRLAHPPLPFPPANTLENLVLFTLAGLFCMMGWTLISPKRIPDKVWLC